ncbi:MAG: xanthine dehydrogenase family protein molybdopterin-binding subunit, partial [Bacteroidetes bacterium]
EEIQQMPEAWFEFNGFVKIGDNGLITIKNPNPEFGQNVKTSMPMIVADELDADWKMVMVEMAPFDTQTYDRQFTGGSAGIRSWWQGLRTAGASARYMLVAAAAQAWQVPASEITTEAGKLHHKPSGRSAGYGEMASAAALIPLPEEVPLKERTDFTIIGTSRKNVDAKKIVTGQPMFGVDYQAEGMLIAMIVHPPAFGMKFKAMDATAVKAMPGIRDVFPIQVHKEGFEKGGFDTTTFNELVAVVGRSTWEVMQAKKALQVEWEPFGDYTETVRGWRGYQTVTIPGGLENTEDHLARMAEVATRPGRELRRDGDPEAAFAQSAQVIERTYSCPFLAHNCLEPMNFFAHVQGDRVMAAGPLQAPGFIEPTLAARLDIPVENIEIEMTRMGGGFGRRAYSHHLVEAALISQQVQAPVKLMYSREDDMTYGIYRPAYQVTFRAGLDAEGQLIAFHVKGGGIPESPVFPNRFPAGAVDHYLAESWEIPSNITIGAFRAPRSNFMAGAEQSFLDEVAEAAGQDPIDFRLALLERARTSPVGERHDYDAERYAGVLKLVKEKSGWGDANQATAHRGVAAYFCHQSYAAHVVEVEIKDGKPLIPKVTSAIDCGIVINPDAATNMTEGAIIDAVGNALYGEMTFRQGVPQKQNFDSYRMIRMSEAPKAIDVHFVDNGIDPTGMGEPPFPPLFGALANALYQATGKRYYQQPFRVG